MPSVPKFARATFRLIGNTQIGAEGWSRAVQTKALPGVRWAATYELPAMKREKAAAWCAFLSALNGRAGRFYAHPPFATTPRGTGSGTPLVTGAGQTGHALHTDGWTAGAGQLLTGDYIAFETPSGWRELHKLTADMPSTGTSLYGSGGYGEGLYGYGEAILSVVPAIRESPADNAAVTINTAACVMRLIDDEQAAWDIDTAIVYGLRFSAEEVWG